MECIYQQLCSSLSILFLSNFRQNSFAWTKCNDKMDRSEYELLVGKNTLGHYRTNIIGNLGEDLNQTSAWRMSFKIDLKNGNFKVEIKRQSEKAFFLWGLMKVQTADSNSEIHYLKLGIYSETTDVKDMIIYLSNLFIN